MTVMAAMRAHMPTEFRNSAVAPCPGVGAVDDAGSAMKPKSAIRLTDGPRTRKSPSHVQPQGVNVSLVGEDIDA
jgi:hypothetical protein